MKLDPRIKSLSDVLTIFDIDRAKEFIGQKGYFADSLYCFDDLGSCYHDTLTDACDGQLGPFHRMESNNCQQFFIPESSLKPVGKKYRPYTLEEFWGDFAVGCSVKFRKKGEEGDELYFILNGYSRRQYRDATVQYINLGGLLFTLKELFDVYEWRDDGTGSWVPFGVEVEE